MSDKNEKLPEKRFWSVVETAAFLNISKHTLYKKMSNGTCPIPVKRPMGGRPMFDKRDVLAYVDNL